MLRGLGHDGPKKLLQKCTQAILIETGWCLCLPACFNSEVCHWVFASRQCIWSILPEIGGKYYLQLGRFIKIDTEFAFAKQIIIIH